MSLRYWVNLLGLFPRSEVGLVGLGFPRMGPLSKHRPAQLGPHSEQVCAEVAPKRVGLAAGKGEARGPQVGFRCAGVAWVVSSCLGRLGRGRGQVSNLG